MTIRKSSQSTEELPRPSLSVSRESAQSKLQAQVKTGQELLSLPIHDRASLKDARAKRNKWHDFNIELLGTLFSNEKFAKEYETKSHIAVFSMSPSSLHEDIQDYKDSISRKINAIESILGRLELIPEVVADASTPTVKRASPNTTNVFLVHGHNEAAKHELASFLKDIGLNPIILNDQPNKGKTIIEKLEFYASQASFAVVLLTPDDTGKAKSDQKESSRARQNVILELGYFIGRLGRDHTCALYKKDVVLPDFELPSDYSGVVYTPMDTHGGWKLSLARELKIAGFKLDLDNLL
jgi:predicted nucleotide-binding protein